MPGICTNVCHNTSRTCAVKTFGELIYTGGGDIACLTCDGARHRGRPQPEECVEGAIWPYGGAEGGQGGGRWAGRARSCTAAGRAPSGGSTGTGGTGRTGSWAVGLEVLS